MDRIGPTSGFLRRNICGHGFALISVVWLAVYFYWREFIPLQPTATISLPNPPPGMAFEFRAAPSGEIVSMLEWIGSGRKDPPPYSGPIQFWNPRTGKLVRQFLHEQDGILGLSRHSTFAAVREGDNIRMVDLRKGETVFLRKATGVPTHVRFSHDERIVSFEAADKTRVFCDAATGKELWSRRIDEWAPLEPRALFADLFLCEKPSPAPATNGQPPRPTPPPDRVWLNAFTGLTDQRFGFQDKVRLAPDSRRAIVWDDERSVRICNYRTGQQLWTLPPDVPSHTLDFSPDGQELVSPVMADSRIFVARWDLNDGRVISPLPDRPYEPVPADTFNDRRYVVHYDQAPLVRGPAQLSRIVNGLGISWDGVLLQPRMKLWLVDTESGKRVGRIALGDFIRERSADRGFAIQEASRVAYYEMPPKSDYRWLAAWSLGPIAAVWLTLTLRRRIRTIRLSRASVPPYNRL